MPLVRWVTIPRVPRRAWRPNPPLGVCRRRARRARRTVVRALHGYILAMSARPFYYHETLGVRITVRPMYLRDRSRPTLRRFVFAYFVRIENVGPQSVQLLSRRWLIHDDVGEDTEVEGEGVVGQQPTIPPGCVHEYQSSCELKSTHGYMEGQYRFARADGSRFEAQIPRFTLHADDVTGLFS